MHCFHSRRWQRVIYRLQMVSNAMLTKEIEQFTHRRTIHARGVHRCTQILFYFSDAIDTRARLPFGRLLDRYSAA